MATGMIKEDLNDLCLNDKSGLSVSRVSHIQFTNVYCYLCNYPLGTKCFYITPDRLVPSIMVILDLSRLRTSLPSKKQLQKPCSDDQFYDEFFKKCRQVKCRIFEIAAAGKCVSIMLRNKLNYVFNFEIVPSQPLNTSSLGHIWKALSVSLRDKFGFRRCSICSVVVKFTMTETGNNSHEHVKFYPSFVFTTSPSCEWNYLLYRAEQLRQTVSLWNVTYMIRYVNPSKDYEMKINILPVIYQRNKCASYYPDRFNCPWTTLTSTEMIELRNQTGNSTTLVTRQNEDGDFELCISAYKNLISGSKSCSLHIKHFTGARVMFLALFAMSMLKDVFM
ncbi:uncharacterized protein LOC132747878 [Ruditapes philippinarum]|uniref:uncharacterized protein LOC132747878 n=1 Tax=Ruditapes philippinarum TaxID=129788 RepID=UPI00295B0F39|nr:uncharacterized protein LOC132747878 [Ruditapes philippinarum]